MNEELYIVIVKLPKRGSVVCKSFVFRLNSTVNFGVMRSYVLLVYYSFTCYAFIRFFARKFVK